MSETIQIQASDGHTLGAYVARPAGEPIGGLVVIQEIFGVNAHMRSVADGYAKDGFLVIAPALFDRMEKDVEIGYQGEDRKHAMELYTRLDFGNAIKDVEAALAWARENSGKKCGVVGFCVGGTLAWLTATRLKPDVAVGYYAGGIDKFAGETPTAPVMLHFGSKDAHITKEMVAKVADAHPDVQIFWYDADHAFNRDVGHSYDAASAKLARERSVKFLKDGVR
jgi:carboxymethylenebutenolidase